MGEDSLPGLRLDVPRNRSYLGYYTSYYYYYNSLGPDEAFIRRGGMRRRFHVQWTVLFFSNSTNERKNIPTLDKSISLTQNVVSAATVTVAVATAAEIAVQRVTGHFQRYPYVCEEHLTFCEFSFRVALFVGRFGVIKRSIFIRRHLRITFHFG